MTPEPPSSPSSRLARAMPSRGLRLLLLLSLALNLLVAGLLLGDALAGGGPGGPPRRVEMSLGPVARALGEEDRRAIQDALRGRPELAALGRGPRGAGGPDFAAILAALRAEPFDPERARAAFAAQARAVAAAQGAAQEALLARLAAMPPEERRAVADRLEAGAGGRGPRP